MKVAVVVAACLGLALVPSPALAGKPCRDTHVTSDPAREARAVRCLINRERAHHGLGLVKRNAALERAAVAYSKKMVREKFFAHESPDGSTPGGRIKAAGYRGNGYGETLAWGTGSLGDAAGTVNGWLNSPGHRAILLAKEMRVVGIGVALGSPDRQFNSGETVTADFGTS